MQTCLNQGEGMTRPVNNPPTFATFCNPATFGLTATYFNNTDFTGAVGTNTVANLNLVASAPPSPLNVNRTSYAIRYTGLLYVNQTDNYIFRVFYQDQFNLYLNDQLIASGTAASGSVRASCLCVLRPLCVCGRCMHVPDWS
jgi:hypothetical protein